MIRMPFLVLIHICLLGLIFAAPLPKKFVDLTYAYDEHSHKFPPFKPFNHTVIHNGTYLDNIWVQTDEISSTTHVGTHMDAPSHFIKGGINIDQLPIENFEGAAAVIDIREKCSTDRDAMATTEDFQSWESITGLSLNETIVLVRTGWGKNYDNNTAYLGNPDNDHLNMHFPGIDPDAAQWLVEHRNIKGIGIDTLSLDRGMTTQFGAHIHLLGHGIYGLENVANLEQMPISGAMLYVMPIKIADASGSPTRVVAVFTEIMF